MFILIYGGSGSGKSQYAENTAVRLNKGNLYYIATMEPYGSEGQERVSRHRELRRGKGFITVEKYRDIKELKFKKSDTVLLECVSNLLANEMFSGKRADNIVEDILYLKNMCDNFVVVTNDVFCDITDYDKKTVEYIKRLGDINRSLAEEADIVREIYYGLEIKIKTGR